MKRFFSNNLRKIPISPHQPFGLLQEGTIISKLPSRSLISVRGPDATSFLQGLTTQDMNLFKQSTDRAAIFTGFLNVKGKTMFDAIIVKPRLAGQHGDEIEYWIDVEGDEDADELKKHLKRYAIRKKLKIDDLSHIIKSF
jgi:folate-binding Fe-S cluster repair protein YgfZ